MKQKRYVVTVAGEAPFPIDMLRYNCLYPHRQVDALAIEKSFDQQRGVRDMGAVTVQLERMAEASWSPNTDRWHSFQWRVLEVSS